MKTLNKQELIRGAEEEIMKFAPKKSHVEIDVIEDPVGNFSTHILLITKAKTYFTKKEDMFLYRSFNKAVRAIKAQVQKKRPNHDVIRLDKRAA